MRYWLIFVHGMTVLLFAGTLAWAGEAGTVIKADELKAEPYRDARTLGKVTAGDKVDIQDRNGGWYKISSARGKGWVRMLNIRRSEASKPSAKTSASGVLGLASGRSGTGQVVATTGIRGLNEEELKSAKFNEAELKRVEAWSVSAAEAQQFAAQGKLSARPLEYLPAPAAQR